LGSRADISFNNNNNSTIYRIVRFQRVTGPLLTLLVVCRFLCGLLASAHQLLRALLTTMRTLPLSRTTMRPLALSCHPSLPYANVSRQMLLVRRHNRTYGITGDGNSLFPSNLPGHIIYAFGLPLLCRSIMTTFTWVRQRTHTQR